MQKAGKEANLSLSPEELALLHNLLMPGETRTPYPLFINGRPGSGKTTILHYLFAEHLHHHLIASNPLANPPLYLTYSPALTERAKETVQTILACDYRRLDDPPDMDSTQARVTINRAFSGFRDMLLSLLDEEARERFDLARYVDFPQFRSLWMKSVAKDATRPSQLRNSPELAWHAIRTFIKGRCPADGHEDDFGPDRYAELPKRQKSIDEELFGQIYGSIWNGWYKPRCDHDHLWDDQDLALTVLRLGDGLARYPAVICDEAQDFTANELAVILRLSLFSRMEVPHYLLGRIPFAFAGDPFQTLNPTGFDWDALSDTFRENLLRELDPAGREKLQVNFRELEFNYRSAEPIVRLCNLVQLLRGILFEVRGLKPQQTWRNETAPEPAFFDIAEAATRDALRAADDAVFIVPSQEESELDYVRADEHLSCIALGEGGVSRDAFNPIRAKGMEFGRVIIYKFGEYCLRQLPSLPVLLSQPKPQAKRDRDRLTHEYFLNRLYVAISRARNRLLIVDTSEAIEKFWRFARGQGYEDLTGQYKSSEGAWGQTNLGMVIKGESGAWNEETQDDSVEIGRQFFDQGKENRDPYLLERAANRFERAGEESDGLKARGWALHFREEYAKAGRTFARIPDVKSALDNFWRAGEFTDYVNLARTKGGARDPRFHAARYMGSHRREEEDAREMFAALYELLTESSATEPATDNRMRDVLALAYSKLIARLDAAPDDERAQDAARGAAEHADMVAGRYDWKPSPSVGHAVLKAVGGRNKEAADVWKALRRPDADAPFVLVAALASAVSYPENLSYLRRIRAFDRIVEATGQGDWSKVPVKEVAQTAVDLRAAGDTRRLEKFAIAIPGTKAFAVFNDIPVEELRADESARAILTKLILRLAKTGELRAFLECVVRHSVQDLATDHREWLASIVGSEPKLDHDAIRALAAADIDRKTLDIPQRDLIAEYFERLLTGSYDLLNGISPFEVGAVIELSGKFKLMQKFYELVLKAASRQTDSAIVSFAQERLVFALSGLAEITKNVKARRRIEEEISRLARAFSVSPARTADHINLRGSREAIQRFYEEREKCEDASETQNVPTASSVQRAVEVAITPQGKDGFSHHKKPLATAVGVAIEEPAATLNKMRSPNEQTSETSMAVQDGNLQKGERPGKVYVLTVKADNFSLEVDCNYGKRRIEIRNAETRETVIVRMRNNVPSIKSADFDLSHDEHDTYHLGDWPVTVAVSDADDFEAMIDLQILDGGPWIRLKF